MENQDLIGKDLAKSMELLFGEMFDNDPDKMAIIKNTKLYAFFEGKKELHMPGYKNPWKWRVTPTPARSKILFDLAIKHYASIGIMDLHEYRTLKSMANSKDNESIKLAEATLVARYRSKYNRILNKIRNEKKQKTA